VSVTASEVTAYRKYSCEKYGNSIIKVEPIDYDPCLDSWNYSPPRITNPIHPEKDELELSAEWYGKDWLRCNVILTDQNSKQYYWNVTLVRSIRPRRFKESDITWRTSAMLHNKKSIRNLSCRDEVTTRYKSNDSKCLWELAGPNPISLQDQTKMLAEESHRIFDPRVQDRV